MNAASFANLLPPTDDRLEAVLREHLSSGDNAVRTAAALELGSAYLGLFPDVAIRLLLQAAEGAPLTAARALLRLAHHAYERDELSDARDRLEQARRLAHGVCEVEGLRVRVDIATMFAAIGQRQAAAATLQDLDADLGSLGPPDRRDAPADPEVRKVAAFASLRLGQVLMETNARAAAEALRRALLLGVGSVAAMAALDLGRVLEHQLGGLGAQIEELYRLAADAHDPFTSPLALVALGDVLWGGNCSNEAEEAWRRAADQGDRDTRREARRRLDDVWLGQPPVATGSRSGRALPEAARPLRGVDPPTPLGRLASRRTADDYGHIRRVIVVGAGTGGHYLLPELIREHGWDVVGFVDDNPEAKTVEGHRVLGRIDSLDEILSADSAIDQLIFAIPTASGTTRLRALQAAHRRNIKIVALPAMFELRRSHPLVPQLRPLRAHETFGDAPWYVDRAASGLVRGRCVMVTGAGSALGAELARRVAHGQPAHLLLVDEPSVPLLRITDELRERRDLLDCDARIVDCADAFELEEVFAEYPPDVVFHCAGLGHARVAALQPLHAARANVVAASRVARLARNHGASTFVLASVDNAALRNSFFDYSKALAEAGVLRLARRASPRPAWEVISAAHRVDGSTRRSAFKVCALRVPNIWAEGGSVVEHFEQQLRSGGPLLVNMAATRRFVHSWEAAQALLRLLEERHSSGRYAMTGGESVAIRELADRTVWINGLVPGRDICVEQRNNEHAKLGTSLWGEGESACVDPESDIVRVEQTDALYSDLLARFAALKRAMENRDRVGVERALSRPSQAGGPAKRGQLAS